LKRQGASSGESLKDLVSSHAISISVILIIVITAGVFSSAVGNGFFNMDDPIFVTRNPLIRDLSWKGILNMFVPGKAGSYVVPLVYLSFAVEYHFFGDESAFIYHLDNVIFHIINSLLVFWFVLILSRKIPVALIVGLLFAVHPLHCESVAWITERKDVLSTLFYVLALVFYLKARQKRFTLYFSLSIVSALLSLLSKPMTVSLPFVLVLCDILEGRRISARAIIEKIPFFVLGIVFSVLTFHFQSQAEPLTLKVVEVSRNLLISSKAVIVYLSKTVIPVKLSVLHPTPRDVSIGDPTYALSVVGVIGILLLTIISLKKTRVIFFSMCFFFITIAPVIGIVPIGQYYVAERYMYIPSIGLFFLLAHYWHKLYKAMPGGLKRGRGLLTGAVLLVIAVLGLTAHERNKVWHSSRTLWQNVLKQYPDNPMARMYLDSRRIRTADLNTGYALITANIARHLYNQGLFRRGIEACENAIKAGAGSAEIYSILGDCHREVGNYDEAITSYQEMIKMGENLAEAYARIGLAYVDKGEAKTASDYFDKAFALDPDLRKDKTYRLAYKRVSPR